MHKEILKTIESFHSIVIFRHEMADSDAIGSQLGLSTWIQETYLEKEVYVVGQSSPATLRYLDTFDDVSDETMKESLAIILDTSNQARVDDKRFAMAKKKIRIDHHVQVETFCDIEWVDDQASATCELLALLLMENGLSISKKAASFLYRGLIADNVRFTTSNVRKESFLAAGYLVESGVDVVAMEQESFAISFADFNYEIKVKEKAVRKANMLASIMEIEDYTSCNLSFMAAKEKVYCLAGIEDIAIWALFTRMEDGLHYSASLRSRTLDIRQIAQAFGGGGHVCASGIKNLTSEQVNQIIEQCAKLSS